MSPPNYSPGCTGTRSSVRKIGIINFWINVVWLVNILLLLNPEYYHGILSVIHEAIVFAYTPLSLLFLYINYKLIQSTNDFIVQKIYQWLMIKTIFLAFIVLVAIISIVLTGGRFRIFFISMPFIMLYSYQIYVVKSFYDEQVNRNFDAATGAKSSARAAVAFVNTTRPVTGPQRHAFDPTTTTCPRPKESWDRF